MHAQVYSHERRGDTQTSAFEWAQGLPKGEPVGTPFLVGTTLTEGEKTIPLRADDAGLIGGVDGGTLVLLEEDRPTGFTSRLTVVASDGSQTILPQRPYATQDEVISPDGTMVAYSSKVYDLNTQSFVADLPANAALFSRGATPGSSTPQSRRPTIHSCGAPATNRSTSPRSQERPDSGQLRLGCRGPTDVPGFITAQPTGHSASALPRRNVASHLRRYPAFLAPHRRCVGGLTTISAMSTTAR